jgi:hypothetical protein
MGICKLCLEEKKLIKAHLLPSSILRRIGDEDRKHVSADLNNLKDHSVKQDGYWDKDILCSFCDNSFSPIEQYFLDFITNKINFPNNIKRAPEGDVLIYNNIDEKKIRLFPLITLWRMSVSKTESCRGVELGPLETMVYQCVKSLDPGPYEFFPFVIYSLKDLNDGRATFIGDPLPLKIDGLMHYLLPISDFIILIRAGKNVTGALKSSAYNNTLEVLNLNNLTGKLILDSLFVSIKSMPRRK